MCCVGGGVVSVPGCVGDGDRRPGRGRRDGPAHGRGRTGPEHSVQSVTCVPCVPVGAAKRARWLPARAYWMKSRIRTEFERSARSTDRIRVFTARVCSAAVNQSRRLAEWNSRFRVALGRPSRRILVLGDSHAGVFREPIFKSLPVRFDVEAVIAPRCRGCGTRTRPRRPARSSSAGSQKPPGAAMGRLRSSFCSARSIAVS